VRELFDRVANDAGVTPEKAESLHDVAANVSDAIKNKAQGLYRQADEAVGNKHFQSFQGAVKNLKDAIRQEVGLDTERDALLQQRPSDAQAGHEAAKETLAAKGIDPGIIDSADSLWRQGSALSDLSKPIQASISGLRADFRVRALLLNLYPRRSWRRESMPSTTVAGCNKRWVRVVLRTCSPQSKTRSSGSRMLPTVRNSRRKL